MCLLVKLAGGTGHGGPAGTLLSRKRIQKVFPVWKSDLKSSRMKFYKNKVQMFVSYEE